MTLDDSVPHRWFDLAAEHDHRSGEWPRVDGEWPSAGAGNATSDDLDQERSRLEAEIAAAKARTAAARHRIASNEAEIRTALRAEIAESQQRVVEMERQHGVALSMIRDSAKDEVARVLADARRQIADMQRHNPSTTVAETVAHVG